MNKDTKIYVAGHNGMLGHAVVKRLKDEGYTQVLTIPKSELDLLNQEAVEKYFEQNKPEVVIVAAGRTGGIIANKTNPARFLYENIGVQTNLFEAAHKYGTQTVVFYGSSCVYPRNAEQPMKESYLLTGSIEETSEGYAAAKIAGLIGCKAYNNQYKGTKYIALLPNSMYGPFDNFDLENSHVLSALISKFHNAKKENAPSLSLWGSGSPCREFIHSEDVADATIFALMNRDKMENFHYNVGTGKDVSIKELAEKIKGVTGYTGEIIWDTSKPDGTPRKLLDSSRFLALGWKSSIVLEDGLKQTYDWFLENYAK